MPTSVHHGHRLSLHSPPSAQCVIADSASDENDDVVDGETAFWDLIESSQITRDGVVNKPRKKPAASMTHPSTCGKDSLSRDSQNSKASGGKKISPASDSAKVRLVLLCSMSPFWY